MKVDDPTDPRLAPLVALRRVIPLVDNDETARTERRILRRGEIKDAVK